MGFGRDNTPIFVYNFEVEGNHNYFVGEIGVLEFRIIPRERNYSILLALFKSILSLYN
jgi:hypothetical protein